MCPSARILLVLSLTFSTTASAQVPRTDSLQAARDSVRPVKLEPITVVGRVDDLIGVATSASQGYVGSVDLGTRPISREGELLEAVPGVIVTQHSGDGKANQYFIRGFNLDHGTDFQTRVEGMPINMPSHAHGQGYTDLNFLIPELVDYIDYRLGVYHAEMGDFGSAGGAEFHLRRRLDRPFLSTEGGQNGMLRVAGAASARLGTGTLLAGAEVKRYDGPWVLKERERKYDAVVRYSWTSGTSAFSLLGMGYRNAWNSTDQIPLRAVSGGIIGRLGHIDPTDGGNTQRYSLSGSWRHAGGTSISEAQVFGAYSDLSLFSNFGFFLDDPAEGDQFNQREHRWIVGGNVLHTATTGRVHRVRLGAETRLDAVNGLGLHRTQARIRRATIREDEVREWSSGGFVEFESRWRPWVRTVVASRADAYAFSVSGDRPENSGQRRADILSPKASVVLSPEAGTEIYLSGGLSFHSNDARGTTITVDPTTGDPAQPVDPLVRSRGAEVGLRVTPRPNWRSTVSVWGLKLDGELLFVGDAGITEPSSPSARAGLTFANFYRPMPELALDLDISLARARFRDVPAGDDRIPGAIENVVAGGVAWGASDRGPAASVRVRHFGSYPLIEDNSVRAEPATLLSGQLGYAFGSGLRLQLTVLNLLDAAARDIQYFYTSRLPGEPAAGVDDIHFHPVEPRQVRITLSWGL